MTVDEHTSGFASKLCFKYYWDWKNQYNQVEQYLETRVHNLKVGVVISSLCRGGYRLHLMSQLLTKHK